MNLSNLKIFTGAANEKLAKDIAGELNTTLGNCKTTMFSDGELNLKNYDNCNGKDVYIVQPTTCSPGRSANDNIMELLMMAQSARRAGASQLTAVIPYFGYARQDRTVNHYDCITAQLCAKMIESAGFDRVLVMDLHAQQIEAFFDYNKTRVVPITGRYITEDYFKEKIKDVAKENVVVLAPDVGSSKNADKLAEQLGVGLAVISKRRREANQAEVAAFVGDVKGKVCLIRDDMIDTAGTICNAAKEAKNRGATAIFVAATHGVLSGPAIERLKEAPIDELALLGTIHIPEAKRLKNMRFLPTAPIFAEYIKKLHLGLDLNAPLPEMNTRTFTRSSNTDTSFI